MGQERYNGFKKLDFHIHTAISFCYSFPEVGPQQVIDAAIKAELDGVAVTDHNTVESVEAARAAAKANGLVVFPGIEITTTAGHFLAIFEPGHPVEPLRELLVLMGFRREDWGDASVRAKLNPEQVIKAVAEAGGLAIGAHVDRYPYGFMTDMQDRQTKASVHNSPYLVGLEITVPHDKPKWNHGLVRNFPKPYGCIQSSDAHAPDEVGRRPFYMLIDRLGLAQIRLAFQEHEERIRFPHEITSL